MTEFEPRRANIVHALLANADVDPTHRRRSSR